MKLLTSVALGAALCALVGPAQVNAAGGTVLSLNLQNGMMNAPLGAGDSIRFTRPQPQTGSVLVTRSEAPTLCAFVGSAPSQMVSSLAVDPNGFIFPYSVADAGFPPNAMFRTGDRLGFADLLYPVPPNVAYVNQVRANCVTGLPQPTAGNATMCDVLPNSFEADRITKRGFERGGELQLTSRIIDSTPSGLYYEHVIRAGDVPVSVVQFREQFPYRQNVPGQARFKSSLVIDSAWSCRASEGAQCSSSSLSDAGLGYAHLDTASLEPGSCLRIVALRGVDSSGALNNDFSGSVHGAVFYPGYAAGGQSQVAIKQSRFDFD